MIANAINLILTELRSYIASSAGASDIDESDYVVPGNIAMVDTPDLSDLMRNRVVSSVVNIAEEATFKNSAHYALRDGLTRYRNAPAFLNLYVLFSANYNHYETALRRLSQVVTFFQGKNIFSLKDSPNETLLDDKTEMRLIMELFALTFEQVNYLWASLGGKQMPFLLYKLRIVRVDADRTQAEAPAIEEIVANGLSV
jgi:hypothetical protein